VDADARLLGPPTLGWGEKVIQKPKRTRRLHLGKWGRNGEGFSCKDDWHVVQGMQL
jgi:hypothetical protein